MAIAGNNEFRFESKMPLVMDRVAVTTTVTAMRPRLASVALLQYKPAEFYFVMRFSEALTTGSGTVKVKAGSQVLFEQAVSFSGNVFVSGRQAVDLADVQGQQAIFVEVDVLVAGDTGASGTIDACLAVEQPLAISGC